VGVEPGRAGKGKGKGKGSTAAMQVNSREEVGWLDSRLDSEGMHLGIREVEGSPPGWEDTRPAQDMPG
jgi:hypothetical protein